MTLHLIDDSNHTKTNSNFLIESHDKMIQGMKCAEKIVSLTVQILNSSLYIQCHLSYLIKYDQGV